MTPRPTLTDEELAAPNAPTIDWATALLYCGEAFYSAALNGTPAGRKAYAWMKALSPGNVVIEVTTARATEDDSRIGVLVEQGREWVAYTDIVDPQAPLGCWEDFTRIRTFDGRDVRWTNCQWARIPVTRDEQLESRR